jgi:hypothetical protein
MPRFFFHLENGSYVPDVEGTDLSGPDEARSQAIQMSGKVLQDLGSEFWRGTGWKMHVTDASDQPVFTLQFSALEHQG